MVDLTTSAKPAPAASRAVARLATAASLCAVTSPTATVAPSASSGQAPAVNMSRVAPRTSAAHAYGVLPGSSGERTSSTTGGVVTYQASHYADRPISQSAARSRGWRHAVGCERRLPSWRSQDAGWLLVGRGDNGVDLFSREVAFDDFEHGSHRDHCVGPPVRRVRSLPLGRLGARNAAPPQPDLAPPAGLEPATHGLGNRGSIL